MKGNHRLEQLSLCYITLCLCSPVIFNRLNVLDCATRYSCRLLLFIFWTHIFFLTAQPSKLQWLRINRCFYTARPNALISYFQFTSGICRTHFTRHMFHSSFIKEMIKLKATVALAKPSVIGSISKDCLNCPNVYLECNVSRFRSSKM